MIFCPSELFVVSEFFSWVSSEQGRSISTLIFSCLFQLLLHVIVDELFLMRQLFDGVLHFAGLLLTVRFVVKLAACNFPQPLILVRLGALAGLRLGLVLRVDGLVLLDYQIDRAISAESRSWCLSSRISNSCFRSKTMRSHYATSNGE